VKNQLAPCLNACGHVRQSKGHGLMFDDPFAEAFSFLRIGNEPDLDRYYYDNVIGGPGAFMVPARNYDTFADAILKKLITEIARRHRIRSSQAQNENVRQGAQTLSIHAPL
jgi:hypothetical protein